MKARKFEFLHMSWNLTDTRLFSYSILLPDSLCTQHSETPEVLDEECIEERSEKMRLAQTPDTSRVSQEYWRQKKGARLFMPG